MVGTAAPYMGIGTVISNNAPMTNSYSWWIPTNGIP